MGKLFLIAITALFLATAGASSPGMAQGGCMSGNDPQARQLIVDGQVVPFPVAASRAGIADDQVVGTQLCRSGGGYVYRVQLRQGGTQSIPAS